MISHTKLCKAHVIREVDLIGGYGWVRTTDPSIMNAVL